MRQGLKKKQQKRSVSLRIGSLERQQKLGKPLVRLTKEKRKGSNKIKIERKKNYI